MSDTETTHVAELGADTGVSRVYEAGYHISPTVQEEDIEKIIADFRAIVEKAGGSFIAEGAPTLMKLAFPIFASVSGEKREYDRGYFGWLKFESSLAAADELRETLAKSPVIIRSMVFRTIREETRAKLRAPQLREVKRADARSVTPRRVEEVAAPVSEADLEKALEDITTD